MQLLVRNESFEYIKAYFLARACLHKKSFGKFVAAPLFTSLESAFLSFNRR